MKKNYYDLLEVSQTASKEVIEKVYKLLAKKYHPDLQPPEKKESSAEIFKEISVAYETLSDDKLRAEYDKKLAMEKISSTVSIEKYQKLEDEYNYLAKELENLKTSQNYRTNNSATQNNYQQPIQSNNNATTQQNTKQYQNSKPNTQYNNYSQPAPKNKGKTTYPKRHFYFLGIKIPNKDDIISFFMTFLIIVIVIGIIAIIPVTRNYFINLYYELPLLKVLVDLFINIIKGIIDVIKNLF